MGATVRVAVTSALLVCCACTGGQSADAPTTASIGGTTTVASTSTSAISVTSNSSGTTTAQGTSISDLVAASTGHPAPVQTVPALGVFPYHVVSAFGSIWVLAKSSGQVTRIDGVTGAVQAVIFVDDKGSASMDRLAASSDAIYVTVRPLVRIDPTDNHMTVIDDGTYTAGVIARGGEVWAGGVSGVVEHVAADGTITRLDLPRGSWMDLAMSNDLVWALSQQHGGGAVIAFDPTTSKVVHRVDIPADAMTMGVRLVGDERNIVVGLDTSGGGGRTGALMIIDPITATVTDTVSLDSRPEGIVLTNHHIWTSGAVIDRTTLKVTDVTLGFTIAQGPDGSIWAASQAGAVRYAPGDFKD